MSGDRETLLFEIVVAGRLVDGLAARRFVHRRLPAASTSSPAGALWVPARSAEADRRGFPTMQALRRIDPSTGAARATPALAGLDVDGLAVAG